MRRLRSYDRERERYFAAVDEARDNVRLTRREYYDALDELEELEGVGPEDPRSPDPRDDDFYEPRRRRAGRRG